jgi:hypothetical protein
MRRPVAAAGAGWQPFGEQVASARLVDLLLRLADNSETADGGFRIRFTSDPTCELVVEARRRVESMTNSRGGTSTWPWTPPIVIEEGSVDSDLTLMGIGVLACRYGRPGSNLMFSLDRRRSWIHHHVITYERGFIYTAVREVSPGRLLYVHDAPRMRAVHVDVKRLD